MKKLTIGIKENDKVIFLKTEKVSNEFDSQKLIKAIETTINIFAKRGKGGDYVKAYNEFNSE